MKQGQLWRADEDAAMIAMWTDPQVGVEDVSTQIGRSVKAIQIHAARLGLTPKPRRVSPRFWTPERVERLKVLHGQRLTSAQIRDELGAKSRNAVIGKLHRIGLFGGPAPKKTPRVPSHPKQKRAKAMPKLRIIEGGKQTFEEPEARPARAIPSAAAFTLDLEAFPHARPWTERAKRGECAWPLDGPEGIWSCAAKCSGTYCTDHLAIRTAGTTPATVKSLLREIRRYG